MLRSQTAYIPKPDDMAKQTSPLSLADASVRSSAVACVGAVADVRRARPGEVSALLLEVFPSVQIRIALGRFRLYCGRYRLSVQIECDVFSFFMSCNVFIIPFNLPRCLRGFLACS